MYSVAIATYNGEQFIGEQLLSILSQTVRPVEIVVGDDGSQDATLEIIREIAKSNPSVSWKIIENTTNLGFVKNFESVISHCTQKFVFLSDQDDTWLETKAEKMLKLLKDTGDKVVFSNAEITDAQLKPTGKTMFDVTGLDAHLKAHWKSGKQALSKLLSGNIVTGATLAFDREYILKMFPFPQSELFIHDSWIAAIAKLDGTLSFHEESLIRYRQHSANAIGISPAEEDSSGISNRVLLEDLICKAERERELLDFLEKNPGVLSDHKKLDYLEKRQKSYEKMISKKKGIAGRFFALASLLFCEKIPNFNTFRAFIGNGYIYVFDIS